MNSSFSLLLFQPTKPSLPPVQRKIGNSNRFSKHGSLETLSFSTNPSLRYISIHTFLRQSREKKLDITLILHIPFSTPIYPPSPRRHSLQTHLTWFDPRSGHIRLPTAVGKSATSEWRWWFIQPWLCRGRIGRGRNRPSATFFTLRVEYPSRVSSLRVYMYTVCVYLVQHSSSHPTKWHCRKDVSVRESSCGG